jgi:hypothetical protein
LPRWKQPIMQFGRALHRVLSTIVHADPRYGPPVSLSTIDIAVVFLPRVAPSGRYSQTGGSSTHLSRPLSTSHCVPTRPSHGVGGIATIFQRAHRDRLPSRECTAAQPEQRLCSHSTSIGICRSDSALGGHSGLACRCSGNPTSVVHDGIDRSPR